MEHPKSQILTQGNYWVRFLRFIDYLWGVDCFVCSTRAPRRGAMIASTNCGEVMSLVKKPDINGLVDYAHIDRLPEEVLKVRRRSAYDKPISEAKAGRIIKLSFQNEKIAANRCLSLRERLKKEKMLAVRRSGKSVYLFPRKLLEKK